MADNLSVLSESINKIENSASLINDVSNLSDDKIRLIIELEKIEMDRKLLNSQLQITNEGWVQSYWRPILAWQYIVVSLFDFLIFPLLTMVLPLYGHTIGLSIQYSQWQPLTLQVAGFYHVSMAAILGVAAWTRGRTQQSLIDK